MQESCRSGVTRRLSPWRCHRLLVVVSALLVIGLGNQQTADLIGTYSDTGKIGSSGAWFDTSAFAQPTGVRFGNTTRNQFYGPGGYNVDLSVFRAFPMGGQRRLEARIEAGNIFNHLVPGQPQGSFTSGTFGQITGINGSYPERQVRLGLRFTF